MVLLKKTRARYPAKGLSGTRCGRHLKHQIPIRTDHRDIDRPGFREADTVAHCGTSMAGSFIWSLTFTDIFSQWTENRAVWNKGATDVLAQVKDLEQGLAFELQGFDVDNGSEFLTFHLWRYFLNRPRPVPMTRSRAYRKNDQAHVEQKNWTHVRQLLGYQRMELPELIPPHQRSLPDLGPVPQLLLPHPQAAPGLQNFAPILHPPDPLPATA